MSSIAREIGTVQVEITQALDLTQEQESLLDMHSFLNVMSVLVGELSILGISADNEAALKPSRDLVNSITASMDDPTRALECARNFEAAAQTINESVASVLGHLPERRRESPEIRDSATNIQSVLTIVNVRIREILARVEEPERWVEHDIDALQHSFAEVLSAIEMNAKGRYRIRSNVADQLANDYVINVQIDSVDRETIDMPPVFQDVMRDLVANARKYTFPGGFINAGLRDDGERLHFAVADTGRGIPNDEIESIIGFGARAANVRDVISHGGGFGLTKAYLVTKQFGGRMWISSVLGHGTKIKIEIPHDTQHVSEGS